MNIKLTFINTVENSGVDIVFFQKNQDSFTGEAIAWKVLKNTSGGWGTPFTFATTYTVAVQDADGAPTPQLAASPGDKFVVEIDGGHIRLLSAGKASNSSQIEIQNDLPNQSINALVYNSEDLIAKLDGGAPGQSAAFKLDSELWIGVGSGIEQGQVMNPSSVAGMTNRFDLLGIASADIVMSKKEGEGVADSDPNEGYHFSLENVVYS